MPISDVRSILSFFSILALTLALSQYCGLIYTEIETGVCCEIGRQGVGRNEILCRWFALSQPNSGCNLI